MKINQKGMLSWFLNEKDRVYGFSNFYWSGLTTLEIYNILKNYILKKRFKGGIFNVSSEAISKYDLLKLISRIYNKKF